MPHRRERERERDLGQKKYVDRGIIREGEEIDWNYHLHGKMLVLGRCVVGSQFTQCGNTPTKSSLIRACGQCKRSNRITFLGLFTYSRRDHKMLGCVSGK